MVEVKLPAGGGGPIRLFLFELREEVKTLKLPDPAENKQLPAIKTKSCDESVIKVHRIQRNQALHIVNRLKALPSVFIRVQAATFFN